MIQLKVFPTVNKVRSNQIYLDLYDTEPIKLTLSIEDITDADATSVFSRTFKVPATRHNNQFFKTAFEVDGTDYDVTIKKPAEILVDGQEFRHGHIRLQKIYVNGDLDKTDYELLFLGETRDFSSIIGDKPLCQLVMPDLIVGGESNPRNPTRADVISSWQAFPESAAVDADGNPNAGLQDGNLLFPLIDHGNTYDDEGVVENNTVRIGANNNTDKSFIHQQYPLAVSQLKPMIRAKRIWDQIFEDAGYTYTSEFIDSAKFHQMYVSAFGNEPNIGYNTQGGAQNLCHAEYDNNTDPQYFYDTLYMPDNIYDPGNNYTVGQAPVGGNWTGFGSYYTAPGTAVAGDPQSKYRIVASAYVFAEIEVSCPGFCTDPMPARLELYNQTTGQVLKASGWRYDQIASLTFDTEVDGVGVTQGNQLALRVVPQYGTDFEQVHSITFQVQQAPGVLLPSADLDCDYKQIDFIKDVLKMFRLVLAPDPNNTNNFIVEPWQTYINSGDLHDWSHKLVNNKDVVLEPLFNTQSEEIEFRMQEDEDYVNHYHQEQYKEVYGYLRFDSNNDLLKGTREIKTLEIAPTPLATIQEESVSTQHQAPGWILPQLHVHEAEDSGTQHLAIKPKTRFLFYNGLIDVPQPTSGSLGWYLQNTTELTEYPLVSSFENWPQTSDGLNLNWANDLKYWSQVSGNAIFNTDGETLYDQYWSRYISSLYGKYSRRMTAYFVLNNVDLQKFSFDDTIFVNGKYWRPEKIIDVNIGERTEVKVQLISANDYKPAAYIDEALTNFSVLGTSELCGCDGTITVNTDGASPFQWQLSNGQTGTAITTGANPQVFDIEDVCAGAYDVTVIDDLGRSNTGSVTIGASTVNVTATFTTTDATSCTRNCDGEADITPAGGTGPYTVTWVPDGSTANPRTDLCPENLYQFYVTDSNGCESPLYDVTVDCAVTQTVHEVRRFVNGCGALESQVYYAAAPSSYAVGTVVTLLGISGCFQVTGYSTQTAQYQINTNYADCAACQGITPPQVLELTSCATVPPTDQQTKYLLASDNPGIGLGEVVNIVGSDFCFEVTDIIESNETHETVTATFDSCASCQEEVPYKWVVQSCSGFDPASPDPEGGVLEPDLSATTGKPVSEIATWLRLSWSTSTFDYCAQQGLAMTYKAGAGVYEQGWYYFRPELNFYNETTLPADTKISIALYDDRVAGPLPGDYGQYVETVYTILLSDYGSLVSGDTNSFTFTTPESYYLPDGHRYALIIHRDDTQPCVGNSATGAIDPSPSGTFGPNCDLYSYYLGDTQAGFTISSEGPLNTGDVITLNGTEYAGCYEVLGAAQPEVTVQATMNENNGIYESCETCTGGSREQNCHEVTATTTPTTFLYEYDDGTGTASYFVTLNSGQTDTICAKLNSITIGTGTGTITNLDTACYATDWGTSCDLQPTPTRYCYNILATPGTYTTFQWFENNVSHQINLKNGDSQDICADFGTVQVTFGTGTITGGTTTCTFAGDCITSCSTYLFEGGFGLDLTYVDCNGDPGYIRDVRRYLGSGSGVLPICISEITGGSAVPFLSAYALCT